VYAPKDGANILRQNGRALGMYRWMSVPPDPRQQHFLHLFMANEAAVRAFVRSLVPTLDDANDVMQEVAIVLWKKFAEYKSSEDFRRWAFGVARFKVLSWQRDRGRDRHVFGLEATELLAAEAERHSELLEAQRAALQDCVQKLPREQRELVQAAYAPGARIEALAGPLGNTAMALYKKLHRIRLALSECVRSVLHRENAR
jgi:RNA polymerase sigma-70 factor (ECF subfamily)